jgi:Transposase DDE domain
MTKIEKIVKELKCFIEESNTAEIYRKSTTDFTRESKLGFDKTILLGISRMTKSIDAEIYNLLTENGLDDVSKSAYTQSRYKIKSTVYVKLKDILLSNVYNLTDESPIVRFSGYKVHALDGSKLTLPNTKLLQTTFGTQRGGSKKVPSYTAMCLLMCSYDVLNHYIIHSEVSGIKTGEPSIAKRWVQKLDSQAITIFDRAYGSLFFCYLMYKYEKPFIIRVKLGFNKVVAAFVASQQTDSIVTFEAATQEIFEEQTMPKGTKIQVRLVKIILPNGDLEVLMTSLFDRKTFNLDSLNELYQLRWGIETAFDRLKNQMQIMCFSGLKPEAIYQDIHATIFVHNLQRLFVNNAQVIVNEETIHCKYPYQVNNNVVTGILKNKIMSLFLIQRPEKIIQELIKIFVKKRIPKIKNRPTVPRKKSIAKRRNIITQLNFKRAC